MLKTFENFHKTHVNNVAKGGVWIIGIPSGESFNIPYDMLDLLYDKQLVKYDTTYLDTGFYAFKDENIKIIKSILSKTSHIKKDIMIFDNDFDKRFMDELEDLLIKVRFYVELYCQDDTLGLSYKDDYYIEITITNSKQKYYLTKRFKGSMMDEYSIGNEKMLLERIEAELLREGLPF